MTVLGTVQPAACETTLAPAPLEVSVEDRFVWIGPTAFLRADAARLRELLETAELLMQAGVLPLVPRRAG